MRDGEGERLAAFPFCFSLGQMQKPGGAASDTAKKDENRPGMKGKTAQKTPPWTSNTGKNNRFFFLLCKINKKQKCLL